MELKVKYADFINQVVSKKLPYSHVSQAGDSQYRLWATDGSVTLWAVASNEDGSKTDFDTNHLVGSNKRSTTFQDLETTGSAIWLVSHNFADKTTWWQKSVRVQNQTLTQISTYVWTGNHTYIIDLVHGKLTNEDDVVCSPEAICPIDHGITFPNGHDLVPTVKDYLGNILTRVDTAPASGQYSIDYITGNFTFGNDWTANPPTASYHYATTSQYDMTAYPNKLYKVGYTEVNIRNIDWNKTFYFEVVVNGVVVARRIYKSESDIISASVGAPEQWGEWTVLAWPYDRSESSAEDVRIVIKSSANMSIRLRLKDDVPYVKKDALGSDPVMTVVVYGVSFLE